MAVRSNVCLKVARRNRVKVYRALKKGSAKPIADVLVKQRGGGRPQWMWGYGHTRAGRRALHRSALRPGMNPM